MFCGFSFCMNMQNRRLNANKCVSVRAYICMCNRREVLKEEVFVQII